MCLKGSSRRFYASFNNPPEQMYRCRRRIKRVTMSRVSFAGRDSNGQPVFETNSSSRENSTWFRGAVTITFSVRSVTAYSFRYIKEYPTLLKKHIPNVSHLYMFATAARRIIIAVARPNENFIQIDIDIYILGI